MPGRQGKRGLTLCAHAVRCICETRVLMGAQGGRPSHSRTRKRSVLFAAHGLNFFSAQGAQNLSQEDAAFKRRQQEEKRALAEMKKQLTKGKKKK